MSQGTTDWVKAVDAAGLRCRAGISSFTVARALGIGEATVRRWETGRIPRGGQVVSAYRRFIDGLARHEAAYDQES